MTCLLIAIIPREHGPTSKVPNSKYLLSTTWAAMNDIVYEYITVRTKIIPTFRTPITAQQTYALTTRTNRRGGREQTSTRVARSHSHCSVCQCSPVITVIEFSLKGK
jgi:hypothetical protein